MADLIGQRLGQYEITALLGEGGMASVYRARQISIQRDVAIKVMKPNLREAPDFVKRFQREAETIAALEHLHVIRIFDYGQHGDLIFIVMQLLQGGSLSGLLHLGPLPLTRVRQILEQIGPALDYAHVRGIIHRDLKPQNVLFDESGNAFLTDFGIARLMDETTVLTQVGAAMGTPAYMAPEQWRGEAADARSDLYALGVMLFEMLAGKRPFNGDTPFSMMHHHMTTPPPPLRTLKPEFPVGLEAVLNKAMAKNPDDRFQSAQELLDVFNVAATGQMPVFSNSVQRKPALAGDLTNPVAVAKRTNTNLEPRTYASGIQPVSQPASPRSARLRAPIPRIALIPVTIVLILLVGLIIALNTNRVTNNVSIVAAASQTLPAAVTVVTVVVSPIPTTAVPVAIAALPSATPSLTLTLPPTFTLTMKPSATFTASPTSTFTPSSTPTATATSSPTHTPTATSTATSSATNTPSMTPSFTSTATLTWTPSATITTTPSATDTEQPVIPSGQPDSAGKQAGISCPGFNLPSRLAIGAKARVLPDNYIYLNSLPSRPSKDPTSKALGKITSESTFTVLDGPSCSFNILWWKVNYNGIIGWAGEGEGDVYWVEPLTIPQANSAQVIYVTATPVNLGHSNATAQTRVMVEANGTSDRIRVRKGPGTNYDLLGLLYKGQPTEAIGTYDNMNWYLIKFQGGTGWVGSDVIKIVSGDPAQLPVVSPES